MRVGTALHSTIRGGPARGTEEGSGTVLGAVSAGSPNGEATAFAAEPSRRCLAAAKESSARHGSCSRGGAAETKEAQGAKAKALCPSFLPLQEMQAERKLEQSTEASVFLFELEF